MNAAVMHAFREPLTLETVPDPVPPPGGVVIRVEACGVCRSDWHALMGHDPTIRLPHIPGHELAGTIAELGRGVTGWRVGERVTVPFCCGCGRCEMCGEGSSHLCHNEYQPGFTGWGAFAGYVALPYAETNLVRLPETLGFVEAASLGCRFMTAFHALTAQAKLSAGEWVVVHGCGGVGLSVVMIAAALGGRVIAVDIAAQKLELARTLGAEHVICSQRPVGEVQELTGGGAHVSFDALGSAVTCRNSVRCLRKKGRHVQVGLLIGEGQPVSLPLGEVISKELEILGSHGMPARSYPALLALIISGTLSPQKLIAKTVTLAEAGAELAAMGEFAQRGVTVIETRTL
jgi:alcohol dehydrogenase